MRCPKPTNETQKKIRRNLRAHTCASRALVTALHTSLRYFSRYFGKSVANEDSSVNGPALLSVERKGSIFH